ncbi:MAG: type IV toxin-antitoxin system AbiEi family antitoxin domain-containing protein [Acidimicrobiales bacterium]
MMDDATLDALAQRQQGLVTAGQLAKFGLSPYQVQQRVRSGRIVLVRRGVFRLCGVAPGWRLSAVAAVLAAGDVAVLSHRSAAVVWDMIDVHDETGPLELTAPGQRRLDGVTTHRARLRPGEVAKHHAMPVTTPERTLLDLAGTCTAIELGRLCDTGLRRRIVTLAKLHAVVAAHAGAGRRRLAPVHAVLADRLPGYDPGASDWEKRMDRIWDRLGLPPAERQYRIRLGRRTYRPDRAIVDLRIAVDWNGFDPHGLRGHFDRDSDRRAALAAAGWYPLDFTSRSRPELICSTVMAVVGERRHLLGVAG